MQDGAIYIWVESNMKDKSKEGWTQEARKGSNAEMDTHGLCQWIENCFSLQF